MNDVGYLPFGLAALALASVPLLHWWLLRRPVAVSGRYSALIDRVRHGAPEHGAEPPMSEAEMIAAMRAMTEQEFGSESVEAESPHATVGSTEAPERASNDIAGHVLFLLGLALGGALFTLLTTGFVPTFGLRSTLLPQRIGDSPVVGSLVLFAGGLLVGVGTRMAGGCTSGHGLCGVSQLQPGSLIATIAFFGAGVATSFALGALG